ncbi:hypothetical protein ACF06N_29575 [Streptomyces albidoflavus]
MTDRDTCGTTQHIPLEGHSGNARKWHKASWSRVLREGITGMAVMLIPVVLLGFFISWQSGLAVVLLTALAATVSSVYFLIGGHRFGCSAKKGVVLACAWWERI